MKKQQSGFTLIELIMVIVILGILSAVALPKFADLSSNAETAVVEGALGSVKSAAVISHSAFLAAGGTGTTVTLDGTTYALENGYPAAETICAAAGLDTTASGDFTCSNPTGTVAVIRLQGATNNERCINYTEAGTGGAAPTFLFGYFVSASSTCAATSS